MSAMTQLLLCVGLGVVPMVGWLIYRLVKERAGRDESLT